MIVNRDLCQVFFFQSSASFGTRPRLFPDSNLKRETHFFVFSIELPLYDKDRTSLFNDLRRTFTEFIPYGLIQQPSHRDYCVEYEMPYYCPIARE